MPLDPDIQPLADARDMTALKRIVDETADAGAALSLCNVLTMHFYWQCKDLQSAIAISKHGLERAAHTPPAAHAGLSAVLAFNIASFCWAGWDEPGIVIGDAEVREGMAAAEQHAALLETSEPDDMKRAHGQWVLGAHLLQTSDFAAARAAFVRSAEYAESVGLEPERQMARAYAALAESLAQPEDVVLKQKLAYRKKELAEMEGGAEFAEQVETAERVFRRRGPEGAKF